MRRVALIGLVAGLALVLALGVWPQQAQAQDETLYYVDSRTFRDGISTLYNVELDGGVAVLTELKTVGVSSGVLTDDTWDNVDVIAATPDGTRIYMIDDSATYPDDYPRKLGCYDVATGDFTVIGPLKFPDDSLFINTDQGAFGKDGNFYITKKSDSKLYIVDPDTAVVTQVGTVKNGTTPLNVGGGDITFDADNLGYLWVNAGTGAAPAGLYTFEIPAGPYPATVIATFMGPNNDTFTGLAFRGCGQLVGSNKTDSAITELAADGSEVASYPTEVSGSPFALNNGDMTSVLPMETAWAKGDAATCLNEIELWAAAGQCDTGKGTLVGTVTVAYSGGTATVTYNLNEGFFLTEAHLWVGNNELPTKVTKKKSFLTAAPGQFPYTPEISEAGKKAEAVVDGLSGDIYVAAHAVVSGFGLTECP